MQHVLGLDHVIILVRDLDDAEARMTRLGFRPTPRGYHSAHMGTANATVMLRNGTYFETLTVVQPTPANADTRAVLALREGPAGLALKTDDAEGAAVEFMAAGIAAGDALDFARPVELPDGTRDARFTVARVRSDASPGTSLFVCQQHTPDVVWREDFLEQPNGATGLAELIGVADDLVGDRAGVRRDLRRPGPAQRRRRHDRSRSRHHQLPHAGRADPALRPAGRAGEHADAAPGRARFAVGDLGQAKDVLRRNGVSWTASRLVGPGRTAAGLRHADPVFLTVSWRSDT